MSIRGVLGMLCAVSSVGVLFAHNSPRGLGRSDSTARSGSHVGTFHWVTPRRSRYRARHAHQREASEALPGVADVLSAQLRSGRGIVDALKASCAHSGPMAAGLESAVSDLDHGAAVAPRLRSWAAAQQGPGPSLLIAALLLGHEVGGSRSRALDAVAATLREEVAARRQFRAQAAASRASSAVLVVAPLAFTAAASTAQPELLAFLFTTRAGLGCMITGLALQVVGFLWMRHIVERAT